MIKRIIIDKSNRLQRIAPFPLLELERAKRRLKKVNGELIDLGEFSGGLKSMSGLSLDKMEPLDSSFVSNLKKKIALWFENRYGVKLNPEREIFPFAGRKGIITKLTLVFLNEGGVGLVPNPGNPIYRTAIILADGKPEEFPLLERNDYLPNLSSSLSKNKRARLVFLNYPNDPTSSLADLNFFDEAVEIASQNNVLLVNDATYSQIYYDEHLPCSLMQIKGAKKVGVEIYLFKTPLGEVGFLVGNREIVSGLVQLSKALDDKDYLMLRQLDLILDDYPEKISSDNQELAQRRDILYDELLSLGWKSRKPKSTPFFWIKVPPAHTSIGFSRLLLRKAGVVVFPGSSFGEEGEGYIRIALNVPVDGIKQACQRIREHSHLWQKRYSP
ncbi:MAG: aminotransferase class I/II-fold pyridoxal phosphate-dependent enzyme [candidate division Zixibacteria bacterium]|nr:aminotransferase class I/II-fold pyridoxal phosphate-dependent enzyme [candidate division Zixibacteria bacterium]